MRVAPCSLVPRLIHSWGHGAGEREGGRHRREGWGTRGETCAADGTHLGREDLELGVVEGLERQAGGQACAFCVALHPLPLHCVLRLLQPLVLCPLGSWAHHLLVVHPGLTQQGHQVLGLVQALQAAARAQPDPIPSGTRPAAAMGRKIAPFDLHLARGGPGGREGAVVGQEDLGLDVHVAVAV